MSYLTIYILTAVISITIALVLVHLAQLSTRNKEMKKTERMIQGAPGADDIKEYIYKQVNKVVGSKQASPMN